MSTGMTLPSAPAPQISVCQGDGTFQIGLPALSVDKYRSAAALGCGGIYGRRDQPAEYSCDLNDRCFTPSGASEIFRMFAQVCL